MLLCCRINNATRSDRDVFSFPRHYANPPSATTASDNAKDENKGRFYLTGNNNRLYRKITCLEQKRPHRYEILFSRACTLLCNNH